MSPSGPHIILLDVPVPLPRVHNAQPPRVNTRRPSSNLRSSCKKKSVPNFSLEEKFGQVREANAVNHQIPGVDQEYRHLVKGPERKIWEQSFANELGKLYQGIRTVKVINIVIFIQKTQVPKDKMSHTER